MSADAYIKEHSKATFQSSMKMIRFVVDNTSDREVAEVIYRALMETCRYLARKFDFDLKES